MAFLVVPHGASVCSRLSGRHLPVPRCPPLQCSSSSWDRSPGARGSCIPGRSRCSTHRMCVFSTNKRHWWAVVGDSWWWCWHWQRSQQCSCCPISPASVPVVWQPARKRKRGEMEVNKQLETKPFSVVSTAALALTIPTPPVGFKTAATSPSGSSFFLVLPDAMLVDCCFAQEGGGTSSMASPGTKCEDAGCRHPDLEGRERPARWCLSVETFGGTLGQIQIFAWEGDPGEPRASTFCFFCLVPQWKNLCSFAFSWR